MESQSKGDLALVSDPVVNRPDEDQDWTIVIRPARPWFGMNFAELWQYRDLIMLFVRRDFVAIYKQTILGPIWFILQPVLTTLVFTLVFGRIAKIPTDGTPQFIFYLAGTVCWGYFSTSLTETSDTFAKNANIFGKVYFPRLVIPISVVISTLLKFGIQFSLFLVFLAIYLFKGAVIEPTWWLLALPLLILQMAMLGLGCGILVSSMTTKYRDLRFLVAFGVQLWMFATPIVYPLSQIPEQYRLLYSVNPMVTVVEAFRLAFFGVCSLEPIHVVVGVCVTLLTLLLGAVLFSRVEKNFMDTV